jgi:hypothetical protein
MVCWVKPNGMQWLHLIVLFGLNNNTPNYLIEKVERYKYIFSVHLRVHILLDGPHLSGASCYG